MIIAKKTVTIREGLDLRDVFYRTEEVEVWQIGAASFLTRARRTNEGSHYFGKFTKTLADAMSSFAALTENRSVGYVR